MPCCPNYGLASRKVHVDLRGYKRSSHFYVDGVSFLRVPLPFYLTFISARCLIPCKVFGCITKLPNSLGITEVTVFKKPGL